MPAKKYIPILLQRNIFKALYLFCYKKCGSMSQIDLGLLSSVAKVFNLLMQREAKITSFPVFPVSANDLRRAGIIGKKIPIILNSKTDTIL
jgi:hypothetical protein